MTPDELALAGQAKLTALHEDYPADPNVDALHRVLTSACIRSANGQNLTAEGLVALGITNTVVPDDAGPGGPGTGKTEN